jgi:hypothetical protein
MTRSTPMNERLLYLGTNNEVQLGDRVRLKRLLRKPIYGTVTVDSVTVAIALTEPIAAGDGSEWRTPGCARRGRSRVSLISSRSTAH